MRPSVLCAVINFATKLIGFEIAPNARNVLAKPPIFRDIFDALFDVHIKERPDKENADNHGTSDTLHL